VVCSHSVSVSDIRLLSCQCCPYITLTVQMQCSHVVTALHACTDVLGSLSSNLVVCVVCSHSVSVSDIRLLSCQCCPHILLTVQIQCSHAVTALHACTDVLGSLISNAVPCVVCSHSVSVSDIRYTLAVMSMLTSHHTYCPDAVRSCCDSSACLH
jgi:hypothetical protein